MYKTKDQRREWFNSLTPEAKQEFIKCKQAEKRENRRQLFAGTNKYNCLTCFHGKTNNCEDQLDDNFVCGYFYDPNSNIQGFEYTRQEQFKTKKQLKQLEFRHLKAI